MGVTGANGFPCCGSDSVDIVETKDATTQYQFQLAQEEEETDVTLKEELLELEPMQKVDLDLNPDEVELELEPKPKEDPEQQEYKMESLQPYEQQDIGQCSITSHPSYQSSAENDRASATHHSICVQTSKHLFWADKLIQTSEHSLQQAVGMQLDKKSTGKATNHQDQKSDPKDTTGSKELLQDPSTQPASPAADSQQPPETHLTSPSPFPAIGLAELVNFASSLALASSSKMDLPNLECMIKAPPQKAQMPPANAAMPPAMDQPEKEELTMELFEKPLEAREPQKAWKQEDKNMPHPYLDFSKPEVEMATIEEEVKLLQAPAISLAISPLPQGAVKEQQKAEDQEIPVVGTEKVQASTEASKTALAGPGRGAALQDAEGEAAADPCPADPGGASIRQGHRG